jgi:4-hydroxymandelate oxidase
VVTDEDMAVNLGPLDDVDATAQAANVTFADIGWLSEISGGLPVVVKGVLRGDDACACRAHGAAAVLVSNHGGRQLDGALPSALALPGVAAALAEPRESAEPREPAEPAAVAGSPAGGEIYADGGIRTGEDVLAALALGAGAVFIGRPVLWALACAGADGVHSLLTGLTSDLAHAMALAGAASVPQVAGLAATGLIGPARVPRMTPHGHGHTLEE